MTGGPRTWSMKVVHGPGPKRGSMDPWSMFCPHPVQGRAGASGEGTEEFKIKCRVKS